MQQKRTIGFTSELVRVSTELSYILQSCIGIRALLERSCVMDFAVEELVASRQSGHAPSGPPIVQFSCQIRAPATGFAMSALTGSSEYQLDTIAGKSDM